MRLHILQAILCAIALAALPASARDSGNKGSSKSNKATPKKAVATAPDHDFECALDPATLKPWQARGIRVPANIKAHFKLWKSVSTMADLSSSAKDRCRKLPPKSAYVKGPGAGATTRADLVVAQQDVPIYRAYSNVPFSCGFNPPAAELGGWWSLTRPSSDKAAYRKATAVCNTWNDFSMIVQCTLKKGTVIVVGTTQSARCTDKPAGCAQLPHDWKPSFASSPEHQVFINTYRRSKAELDRFLIGCRTSAY